MPNNEISPKETLLSKVNLEVERCHKGEKFYDPIRWQVKIAKILIAMATAGAAVWTGITQEQIAAIITSIGGVSTVGLEAMQKEIQANKKRYHYLYFSILFEGLKSDIQQVSDFQEKEYKQYNDHLKNLKLKELEERKKMELNQ